MLLKEGAPWEECGEAAARPDRCVALAVDAGAADVVQTLLQSRACVNGVSGTRPPLLTAVRDGHHDIVEALCACPETQVDAQDSRGASSLHEAVHRQSLGLVSTLLTRRACPTLKDKRGWSPLHLAAHLGSVDVIDQLLRAGAHIDGSKEVAAEEARFSGPSRVSGPSVAAEEDRAARSWTPLHLLLAGGDEDSVRQMVVWGADACRPGGPDGVQPLMLAISLGLEAVAIYLLGLDSVRERVDDQDLRGRCALHFAVSAARGPLISVVRGLLEAYAAPHLKNDNGLIPIEVARNAGIPEESQVVKKLQVEEAVRLVMQRSRCRAQNKYEESELIRGDLRLRGVSLDVQNERWMLPDGTWGYLAAERSRAQAQGGPGLL
mmetsp:Transcript_21476/g.46815  ORF Transcript_21476/g.46815 Transcript_21476/m.46815 type:complete len:378 (-) Transcript_21476:51-1184(-)